jgi:hypothetical protein
MVPQRSRGPRCGICPKARKGMVRMSSEMFGCAREAADWNFPLVAERIAQLQELLEIGLRLKANYEGDEELPAEAREASSAASERATAEILDALIYGAPQQIAAFLAAGQAPETVAQINEWLPVVTGAVDPWRWRRRRRCGNLPVRQPPTRHSQS